jgi:hypothetical protein
MLFHQPKVPRVTSSQLTCVPTPTLALPFPSSNRTKENSSSPTFKNPTESRKYITRLSCPRIDRLVRPTKLSNNTRKQTRYQPPVSVITSTLPALLLPQSCSCIFSFDRKHPPTSPLAPSPRRSHNNQHASTMGLHSGSIPLHLRSSARSTNTP